MRCQTILVLFLSFLVLTGFGSSALADDLSPLRGTGGGAHPQALPGDQMTSAKRASIQAQIDASVAQLRAAGKLPATRAGAVTFEWPVVAASHLLDPGVHGISNFVDQNPTFPNVLLDYQCGTRTYDLPSGYNHRGIDIFTWPYGWARMDYDAVEIVAAAPGTIVFKSDGNFDRSCGFNNGDWNAVYVQHADGSIAWYGHMKSGSPTAKSVGDTVAAGEYLGVIGSSGSSTGPHLHLEVYDDQNQLIEPYAGICNSLNSTSWWANQRDYHDSGINRVETAAAPPAFPACPTAEPNFSRRVFASNEPMHFITFYRDQLNTTASDYTLFQPDGGVYWNWQHTSDAAHYAASFWYWIFDLSAAPTGTWRFRAAYEGDVVEREFEMVAVADSDGDGVNDHLDNCINSANASQYDANSDGYGNACDADFNNDGIVNAIDLGYLKTVFFSTDAIADMDGSGVVNALDLGLLKIAFFQPPGPSAYVP